jgi:hypothetical protein
MITLESGGMLYSKKIAYSISKIPIPRNERKQTGPNSFITISIYYKLFLFCRTSFLEVNFIAIFALSFF